MENYEAEAGTSTAKVNIGIRIAPELKTELNYEAVELGQSSSEYGEAILHNRHNGKEEIGQFKLVVAERDKQIEELKMQRLILQGNHQDELANYKKETDARDKHINALIAENKIFQDPRLLYILKNLFGTTDVIKDGCGGKDISITYKHPIDVLHALIYGTKVTK